MSLPFFPSISFGISLFKWVYDFFGGTEAIDLLNKNKIDCFIGVSKKCTHVYNAKKLLEILSKKYTLKGGGSDTFATLIIDVQDKSAFHKTLEKIFNVTK